MVLHEGSTAHFAAALKVVAQVVKFKAKVNRLVRGLWLFCTCFISASCN